MSDRSTLRALEVAVFVAVFVAGTTLSWLAIAGDEKGTAASAGAPGPLPMPGTPLLPTPPVGGLPEAGPTVAFPEGGEMVQISGARSNITPGDGGCSGRAEFIWEVDPVTAPSGNQRAVVLLTGPTKAGEYTRRVVGGEIRFAIELKGFGVWTANVVTVGGRQAFPTPLPVSLTTPGC